jgi:hypothetical protein
VIVLLGLVCVVLATGRGMVFFTVLTGSKLEAALLLASRTSTFSH